MKTESLKQYINELNRQYRTEKAREHAYRPALKDLLESLLPGMVVTNEPAHFECGAPDYIISREKDHLPVFFVEAKDIGDNDLDGRSKSGHKEQFDRYRQALDYIIFTDYLDFHLYEHGESVNNVRIAELRGDKIVGIDNSEELFLSMVEHLATSAIQPITSASRLAKQMAGKARLLENIIEQAMADETYNDANDNLRGQFEAFKDVLIQELKPTDFADIYAQTIAYGMFAARLHDDTPEDFSREEAARLIPKTNPFLRQIFNNLAGNDLDERITWVVDDLVTVFRATDLQQLMRNYSQDKRHHDPMIHFYEDFLSEYNPKLRKSKGVWYTPQPVVGFIVRAVDEILQREFGLPEGLADYSMTKKEVAIEQSRDRRTTDGMKHEKHTFHRVQILDPAAGTGTFLAEVVNQIYDRYRDNQGMWQQYVEQHLLPRLHGFEILMASYAVAHLKLDMLLGETGYRHRTDKRLQVFLTNSLEESNNEPRTLFAQWLSREATGANTIKRDCPVMVMIGNPPYSVSSQNKGKWITGLVNDYKQHLNERNIQPLSDDYIKFIRLGQHYVEKEGEGILAYISNNSFLDGVIHREMRHQLLLAFDDIYVVNLHGNYRKEEQAADGSKDENVFDIMQGVSINIFVRKEGHKKGTIGKVHYKDLYGSREDKYTWLNNHSLGHNIEWTEVACVQPYYFMMPKDFSTKADYERGFSIENLMSVYTTGLKSQQDKANIFFNQADADFMRSDFINMTKEEIKSKYGFVDNRDWTVGWSKDDLEKHPVIEDRLLYRPFDIRFINYTGTTRGVVGYPRYAVLGCMIAHDNISLCTIRSNRDYHFDIIVSDLIADKTLLSSKDDISQFPLYITKENMGVEERIPNLSPKIVKQIEEGLGEPVAPEELFDYIYAVLHSPSYRERYKEFLKIDFPRIPFPTGAVQYHRLAEKGAELRRLHLMEDLPSSTGVSFPIDGSARVDCYRWQDNRVYINDEQYFDHVPATAWQFYIGGYQPAQKWLKDRRGRTLTFDDLRHYQRIIYVLLQTERIMKEIDEEQLTNGH